MHVLDINKPVEALDADLRGEGGGGAIHFRKCNVASWDDLRDAFNELPSFEYVFANAGVSEECDYFTDALDASGRLAEPSYGVLDTNLRAVLNTVKLGWSLMRQRHVHGSIVITTSATAYAPEQSLPVYAAGKLAVSLIGVLGMRSRLETLDLRADIPYLHSLLGSSVPSAPSS